MTTARYLTPSLILTALGSCVDPAPDASRSRSDILTSSRRDPRVVSENRESAIRIADSALSDLTRDPDRGGSLRASRLVREVASSPGGLDLLSLLIPCALSSGVSISIDSDLGEIEIPGEIGLAIEWAIRPLGAEGRGWVSACVFSRLSGSNVAEAISARGGNPALRTDLLEREIWRVEEGAFFGSMFNPIRDPLAWAACRGRGSDSELAERSCAVQDPDAPGLTMCGLRFSGECDEACDPGSGHYVRCRSRASADTETPITIFLAR